MGISHTDDMAVTWTGKNPIYSEIPKNKPVCLVRTHHRWDGGALVGKAVEFGEGRRGGARTRRAGRGWGRNGRWEGLDAGLALGLGDRCGPSYGNIKTLILSCTAVEPCLLALERDTGTDKNSQQFPQLQTLIIHSRSSDGSSWSDTLRTILPVARGRKVAGCPFESVSVFLQHTPGLGECEGKGEELEELRGCVERFGLATGGDVLDWDINEYFLDGLDHLRNRRNAR